MPLPEHYVLYFGKHRREIVLCVLICLINALSFLTARQFLLISFLWLTLHACIGIDRGITLTELCLHYYATKREPEQDWVEWKKPDQRSKPWIAYNAATWQARAETLRVILINYYGPLAQSYSDYSPLAANLSAISR